MNIASLLILSAALCIDSGVISLTVGLQKNVKSTRGLRLAAICALCQGGLFFAGILVAGAVKNSIETLDHWFAFALLSIIGVKMLLSIRKSDVKKQYFDISHTLVLFVLAFATSIDALIIGIGLGIQMESMMQKVIASSMVFVMTFIFSIGGFYLGRKNKFVPVKFSTVVGGLTLIGFGVKVLLDHGVF